MEKTMRLLSPSLTKREKPAKLIINSVEELAESIIKCTVSEPQTSD